MELEVCWQARITNWLEAQLIRTVADPQSAQSSIMQDVPTSTSPVRAKGLNMAIVSSSGFSKGFLPWRAQPTTLFGNRGWRRPVSRPVVVEHDIIPDFSRNVTFFIIAGWRVISTPSVKFTWSTFERRQLRNVRQGPAEECDNSGSWMLL
jgi:hypothetical protein